MLTSEDLDKLEEYIRGSSSDTATISIETLRELIAAARERYELEAEIKSLSTELDEAENRLIELEEELAQRPGP